MANDTNGLTIAWIAIDVLIIFLTLAGNILTICAIQMCKKIGDVLSNRYIFSLAVSDLMVGLTIPYHLSFTIGQEFAKHYDTCILRFVLAILACSSSIYNLLAIAADRYIAIIFPFHYGRHMCKMIVGSIVLGGWFVSISIATTPIYWNSWNNTETCKINEVLDRHYVTFIITPMFMSIWLAMSVLYFRIWREASEHAKRLRSVANFSQQKHRRILQENKSVQMVLLILGCFSICWLPYFITVTYMFLSKEDMDNLYEAAFTMAVTNSCMNPIIYAWKSENYRKAFWCLLKCKSPRLVGYDTDFITNYNPNVKRVDCEGGECNKGDEGIAEQRSDCTITTSAKSDTI